mmetsp:Transcript_11077/g.14573  ORF Transcript_11077/g.14573 Transcript_11077/m.14573 type:complete len:111 (-) Transcript_11077:1386-1718(-)
MKECLVWWGKMFKTEFHAVRPLFLIFNDCKSAGDNQTISLALQTITYSFQVDSSPNAFTLCAMLLLSSSIYFWTWMMIFLFPSQTHRANFVTNHSNDLQLSHACRENPYT